MNDRIEKYLVDIDLALSNINDFLTNINSFDGYQLDSKTRSAVERQLIIIGEAANKLRQTYPTLEISNVKEIVLFRNRVVHAYDSIDDTIVWAIIKKHLPLLQLEVNKLLNK